MPDWEETWKLNLDQIMETYLKKEIQITCENSKEQEKDCS